MRNNVVVKFNFVKTSLKVIFRVPKYYLVYNIQLNIFLWQNCKNVTLKKVNLADLFFLIQNTINHSTEKKTYLCVPCHSMIELMKITNNKMSKKPWINNNENIAPSYLY